MADPSHALESEHLFGHVQDAKHFDVPQMIAEGGKLKIWQPFEPFVDVALMKADPNWHLAPFDLSVTKFMVLEIIAAALMVVFFIPLAKKIADGSPAKGKWANMLEAMLVFIRDEVARPTIGKQDADRFLPFLWTMFFFVLICNLIGLAPLGRLGNRCLGDDFHAGDDHLRSGSVHGHGPPGIYGLLEIAGTPHGIALRAGDLSDPYDLVT